MNTADQQIKSVLDTLIQAVQERPDTDSIENYYKDRWKWIDRAAEKLADIMKEQTISELQKTYWLVSITSLHQHNFYDAQEAVEHQINQLKKADERQ